MSEALASLAARRRRAPNPLLLAGGILLLLFVLLSLVGPAIAPYPPDRQDLLSMLAPPSARHFLGTDALGRDILSRVIVGTRYTLGIAVVSVAGAGVIGTSVGLVSGFAGGWLDEALTGLSDLVMTVPSMVLAIAVVAAIGASATGLAIAIITSFTPPLARLVRARVLELRGLDFILAARATGRHPLGILLGHVLPNAATVIVVQLSLMAGQAVLMGAALGFLGLGVQPPTPEWGAMLGASRQDLSVAPAIAIGPGLAIALLVLAFNILGDGLRDHLDPRSE